MKNYIVQFDRRFKLWFYTVSHGQLLLRSTKDDKHLTQIDVLFKNVAAISVPTLFEGLTITAADTQEESFGQISTGLLGYEGRKSFLLSGKDWNGVVIAGVLAWNEEDAEHYSDSKLLARFD